MTQQTLQTAQYNKLRSGRYAGTQLIKLFSNRVVLHGTITTDLSAVTNWASFGYTTISGSYTNCLDNQVLVICATDDVSKGANSWYGRLRGAPGSGTITCNESSDNFSPGAYFWVLDTFAAQYIYSRPSTNDPLTALELVNYDQSYQGILPSIVGLPFCIGGYPVAATGKFRYAFDLSSAVAMQSGATIASYLTTFPSGTLVTGSLSTAFFVMDFSAGEQWGKVTATDSNGLTLTRHVGIQVLDDSTNPPDVKTKGAAITSQLDQGVTMTLPAFGGVDSVLNNTLVMAIRTEEQLGGVTDTLWGGGSATVTNKALTSNTATITATNSFKAGEQVVVVIGDSAFDGTYLILSANSAQFTYHKVHADVGSTGASGLAVVNPQNVDFVGWYQRETDPITPDAQQAVISTANFTFTGIGPRMQRLGAQLLALVQKSSPSLWGDINNLTPWRAIWHFLSRYTTLAGLIDISFDDYTGAFQFPAISTQGGNVHSVVAGIAKQITAYMEFNPTGSVYIARSATYLNAFQRLSLPVNGNWTTSDVVAPGGISRDYQPNSDTGKVDWTGAFYNTSSGAITSYTSRAPGIAAGEGAGTDTTADQILLATTDPSAALTELKQRVGARLLEMNNNETLDAEHPAAYATIPIVVSRSVLYSWALDANVAGTHGVNRVVYTSSQYWLVENTTMQFNEDRGYFTTKTKYRILVPVASPGDDTTQNIPAQGEIQNTIPDFTPPAFNFELPEISFPDPGSTNPAVAPPLPSTRAVWANGQELIVWSTTKAFFLRNFIALTVPTAIDITPSNLGAYLNKQVVADPASNFTTQVGAFEMASDGANTAVWNSSNIATTGPLWTKGADVTGVFTVMRATPTADSILIYTPSGTIASTTYTDNLNSGLGSKTKVGSDGSLPVSLQGAHGAWSSSGGIGGSGCISGTGDTSGGVTNTVAAIVDLGGSYAVTAASFYQAQNTNTTASVYIYLYDSSGSLVATYLSANFSCTTSFQQFSGSGATPGVRYVYFATQIAFTAETFYLDNLSVTYNAPGSDANAAYSANRGVTFAPLLDVGATPGSVGGFDVQRAGTNSFAAADAKVRRATTLGSAYSDYYAITGGSAQAACIIVPFYAWSGGLNTSATNPDILVALTALDGSSRSLLWIEGGATPGTVHDLTPTAGMIFDNPNCVTISYQHHIAVFGKVSGTYHLYTTYDKGSTWHDRGALTSPTFIRDRRQDVRAAASGSLKGQLYLAGGSFPATVDYSSVWASGGGSIAGLWPRTMPVADITGLETIW